MVICTTEELDYLRNFPMEGTTEKTAMVSMLYQYGLFVERDYEKEIGGGPVRFTLSDFAKALKQNCSNFMDGLNGEERLTNYEQLTPIKLTISPRIV